MNVASQPETFVRYTTNLNVFGQWLARTRKPDGSLDLSDLKARGIEVPDSVAHALDSAIGILSSCVAWYTSRQNLAGVANEERKRFHDDMLRNHDDLHDYLKALRDALRVIIIAHYATRKPVETTTESTTTSDGQITVTQVSQSSTSASSVTEHNLPSLSIPKLLKPSDDCQVAIDLYCFIKDCHTIRLFVYETWQEFHRKEITLQTASLIANASLAMIKRLSDGVEKGFGVFGREPEKWMQLELINFLRQKYCYFGDDDLFPGPSGSVPVVPFEEATASNVLCDRAVRNLDGAFRKALKHSIDGSLEMTDEEMVVIRCFAQLRGLSDTQITDTDDQALVWKRDHIYKASRAYIVGSLMSSWIIIAAQMLCDTHCVLGSHTDQGDAALKATAEHLRISYRELANIAPDHAEVICLRIRNIERLVMGYTFQSYADKRERSWRKAKDSDQAFRLLPNHPALCGIIQAELRDAYHKLCIDVAGTEGCILTVAHFYNAVKKWLRQANITVWSDMEFFIDRHDMADKKANWLFGSKKPRHTSEAIESICAILGLSPLMYPPSDITDGTAHQRKARWLLTAEDLNSNRGRKRRLRYMARSAELSAVRDRDVIVAPSPAARGTFTMASDMARDITSTAIATPTRKTLNSYKSALERDEVILSFDVLKLHTTCRDLLQNIQDHCVANAPQDYRPEFLGDRENMDLVVIQLLRDLQHFERPDQSMLSDAVRLMEKVIVGKGSDSSGRLAKAKS